MFDDKPARDEGIVDVLLRKRQTLAGIATEPLTQRVCSSAPDDWSGAHLSDLNDIVPAEQSGDKHRIRRCWRDKHDSFLAALVTTSVRWIRNDRR